MASLYQFFGHGERAFAKAGTVVASVYLVGLVLIWFMPETKGRPLPE